MPIKLAPISRQKDFEKIWRQGKFWQNKLFILRLSDNVLPGVRAAVIVSNKISKKAVARNKLRRRVKETIRQEIDAGAKGLDLVFIAKPGSTDKEFTEIKAAIVDLLTKANV